MAAHDVVRSVRTAARDTRPHGGCDDASKDQSRPRPARRLSGISASNLAQQRPEDRAVLGRPSSLTVGAAVGTVGH